MSGRLIADSHQTFAPYSVTCTCGATFEAETHDRLAAAFARHRAALTPDERAANMRRGIRRTGAWGVS
jgi:hypothetical protein